MIPPGDRTSPTKLYPAGKISVEDETNQNGFRRRPSIETASPFKIFPTWAKSQNVTPTSPILSSAPAGRR